MVLDGTTIRGKEVMPMTHIQQLLTDRYTSATAQELISSVLGRMQTEGVAEALVFDDNEQNRLQGIFSHAAFMRARLPSTTQIKVGRFVRPIPTIATNTPLTEAMRLMIDGDTPILPVYDADSFTGAVDVYSVLWEVSKYDELADIFINDLPLNHIPAIFEYDRLGKLIHYFHAFKKRELPVLDKDHYLSGQVLSSELLFTYYLQQRSRERVRAGGTYSSNDHQPEETDVLALPVEDFVSERRPLLLEGSEKVATVATRMAQNLTLSAYKAAPDDEEVIAYPAKDIIRHALKSLQEEPESIHVRFPGIRKTSIGEDTRARMQEIVHRTTFHLTKYITLPAEIVIHMKEYHKHGESHKYSAHIRSSSPEGTEAVHRGTAWDPVTALRMSLQELQQVLARRYSRRKNHNTPAVQFTERAAESEEAA